LILVLVSSLLVVAPELGTQTVHAESMESMGMSVWSVVMWMYPASEESRSM
jgi:hypothetical protein